MITVGNTNYGDLYSMAMLTVGTANANPFRGFPPGELQLVGATGRRNNGTLLFDVDMASSFVVTDPESNVNERIIDPCCRAEWPAEGGQVEYRFVGHAKQLLEEEADLLIVETPTADRDRDLLNGKPDMLTTPVDMEEWIRSDHQAGLQKIADSARELGRKMADQANSFFSLPEDVGAFRRQHSCATDTNTKIYTRDNPEGISLELFDQIHNFKRATIADAELTALKELNPDACEPLIVPAQE